MPREHSTTLSQPVFDESRVTPDPNTFKIFHDPIRDSQLFAEFKDMMTKDVASFNKVRGEPGDLFTLESALGSKGADKIAAIKNAKQITFHAGGDTGAPTDTKGKYQNCSGLISSTSRIATIRRRSSRFLAITIHFCCRT